MTTGNDGAAEPVRPRTNPLLEPEGLSSLRDLVTDNATLVKALVHRPFDGHEIQSLSNADRLLLVPSLRRAFVPAPDPVQVAARVLYLLYFELDRRNPLLQHNQKWVNKTSQWLGANVDSIPWQPVQAQGMVIEGMTGIGKSHAIERTLSLLPQVVEHFPNGEWGMQYLKHLVWLRVQMPADHSRLGFLTGVLQGMDDALGTNYAQKHAGPNARVERLIVVVMHQLVQHRCGLLVIEEAQVQNLAAYSRIFLNFFLRLLNWGIPVVLVGNPLAFELIQTHAQDVDRFCEGGWITLLPPLGPEAPVWKTVWIPGLWKPTLLDAEQKPFQPLEAYPGIHEWHTFLWQLTGGLPRQLCRLRTEVLDAALRRGCSAVDSQFVYEVFRNSPRFIKVRERNAALANHDLKALMAFEDLPREQLRRHWASGKPPPSPDAEKDREGLSPAAAPPPAPEEQGAFKDTAKRLNRDLRDATERQQAKRPGRARGPEARR
ncbi:MAG: hypothetical protein EON59_03125 [Alphaproteobacteria bacterium]|nr:MAG: hypothetical protein EON59_03125 [Alphaproteobacteria bacterium]